MILKKLLSILKVESRTLYSFLSSFFQVTILFLHQHTTQADIERNSLALYVSISWKYVIKDNFHHPLISSIESVQSSLKCDVIKRSDKYWLISHLAWQALINYDRNAFYPSPKPDYNFFPLFFFHPSHTSIDHVVA